MSGATLDLLQDLPRLHQEAARYRWLRDHPGEGEQLGIALMFLEPDADGVGSLLPAECDRRIDEAMRAFGRHPTL